MLIDARTAAARLLEQDNIVLCCHRDPDGDTYGSATALALALLAQGKRVRIECPSEWPKNLSHLAHDYPDFEPAYYDSIDCASPNMLGDGELRQKHISLCIDHHPTNPDYADETFLVGYAAAGEAVYEVLREMKADITPDIATALFTALSSDTGSFRFANTSPQTHRYAAELMELGADVETIRVRLIESKSRGRIRVESEAMANAHYYHNGEIAVIRVPYEEVVKNGVEDGELEGLASEPLTIDGVHVAVTIKEKSDGTIRVSMRCDDRADVSAVCQQFGGGGHVRAAGCRLDVSLDEAERLLSDACVRELDR